MKIPALVAVGLMVGTAAIYAQSIQLVGITNSVWRYSIDNSDQYALGFPNVDDSVWPEGRAVFGNDPGYPYPNVVLVPGSSIGVQTSYYRTRFNWAGGPPGVLIMTNYIDDGLFVFLNGTLIFNWNVNGEPAHATQAAVANPGGEPVRVVHQVLLSALTNGNANPLIGGQNVLAVSVHQAGTGSSDSVFAMSVYSSPPTEPCPIGISPTSTNAIQCHNVTLKLISLVECGLPVPTIQWFHDDSPIAGATAATLTLMNVQPGVDDGQYYARLSNPIGTADSAHAAVYVAPDTQGPRIVSVSTGFTADNRWLVTFDEPVVSLGGADDTSTYDIRSFGTPPRVFGVLSAVIQSDPTEVLLITDNSRFFGENYGYSTSQAISDVCGGVSTPPGLTGPVWVQSTIIDDSKDWRYNDAPQDQGTAWVAPSFDDSGWKTGRQMFDRHRADLDRAVVAGQSVRTFLELTNYTVSPPTNLTTVYLRLKQTIPAGIHGLVAYPIYDDGFIMYINGTEVYRTNVVAGADQFANYGGAGGINAGDANYVAPFAIPLSAVMLGAENTIAVMLKQNDATSSDMTFGLRLVPTIGDPTPEPCSIVRQPEPTSVSEGHALTLRVLANCTGPTYQWFKDGLAIAGATSATYSKLATTADAGNYWVAVSNLRGTVSSTPVAVTVRSVIVPYGFTWKYEMASQDETLSGTPWYAAGFDDSAWPSGPGPFGIETTAATLARLPAPIATVLPVPSATFLTAYFRTTVTVPAVGAESTLVLTHLVDDGAIFYVDGVRVLNYNGPTTNPTRSSDLAPGTAPGDGDAMLVSWPITLPAGSHTIAVELHQNLATSSDVVFGAELRTVSGVVPSLAITHPTPTSVTVAWTPDPLYSLYQATAVTGLFLQVGGNPQGSYSVADIVPNAARYFQLRYNGR